MRIILPLIIFFCILICKSCKPDNSAEMAERYNDEGLRLINEGKSDEAIASFHQALSYTAVPGDTRGVYFSNLALSHDALGNIDSAKIYFRKAIKSNEKGSFAYYTNYGQLYLMDSMVARALNSLEKSHHLNSEYGPTNNLLGLIYLGTYDTEFYDPEKALPYNIKAYETLNGVNCVFTLAQNYYYLEKVEKSVSLFKELHRDYPDNSNYLSTVIMMEQELGNDVSNLLDKLKALDPERFQELMDDPVKAGSHTIVW